MAPLSRNGVPLRAVKKLWGDRLITVFPRQGHYAHDPEVASTRPTSRSSESGCSATTFPRCSARAKRGGKHP